MRAQIPTIPAWPGPNRPETARGEEVARILVGLGVRLFKTQKLSHLSQAAQGLWGKITSMLMQDLHGIAAIAAIAMMHVAMPVHVHTL